LGARLGSESGSEFSPQSSTKYTVEITSQDVTQPYSPFTLIVKRAAQTFN